MFLDRILVDKRAEVEERRAETRIESLQRAVYSALPARDFVTALRQPGLAVIAEIKRASPSRGPIAPVLDPTALASRYVSGGCSAISVLTDRKHFGARPDDLPRVRKSSAVPVLRKDFIIDEYQLWESRAMGADAALLIVAALASAELRRMIALAREIGICPLVEVHTEEETRAALDAGARVIGINNRDLRSFDVDVETTLRLARLIPSEVILVSESGVSGPREAQQVASWGADAILVGEALVVSQDPAALIGALRAQGNKATQESDLGRPAIHCGDGRE